MWPAGPVTPTSRRPVPRRVAAGLAGLVAVAVAAVGVSAVSGQPAPIPAPPGAVEASTRASGADPAVRLAVAGDVGTGDDQERRTAAAAASRAGSRGWDALVLLGENPP